MALSITINDSWELGSRSGKKKLIVKDVTVIGDGFTLSFSAAEIGLTTVVGCTASADATSLAIASVAGNMIVFSDGASPVAANNGVSTRFLVFGLE